VASFNEALRNYNTAIEKDFNLKQAAEYLDSLQTLAASAGFTFTDAKANNIRDA